MNKIIVKKPSAEEVKEALLWPIWEKEISDFPWDYDEKETCYITEGRAIVDSKNQMANIGEGDYVIFPKGFKSKWKILKKVKKHYKFG